MQTVLITGASRGIGLEFCKQYLADHCQVYACCRHPEKAIALHDLKSKHGEKLHILSLDITIETSISALANELHQQPIDILINNAGMYEIDIATDHLHQSTWQLFFTTNTIGHYLLTQTLLPNVTASETKKIINISSNMGSINLDNNGINVPYRASKAALNAVTKSLSVLHHKENIIFIAMHPGWVRTDMGGPRGNLSVEVSVTLLRQQIDKTTMEDTGKYLSYAGEELPW